VGSAISSQEERDDIDDFLEGISLPELEESNIFCGIKETGFLIVGNNSS